MITREIRTLKNKKANIPIVAMTAMHLREDRKKALMQMDGHIAKPIDVLRS